MKCSCLDQSLAALRGGIGCQHDNWKIDQLRMSFHLLNKPTPIKIVHPQVSENKIHRIVLKDIQCLSPIVCCKTFKTSILQGCNQDSEDGSRIINYQYTDSGHILPINFLRSADRNWLFGLLCPTLEEQF